MTIVIDNLINRRIGLLLILILLMAAPKSMAQQYRAMYEGQEVNLKDGAIVKDLFILHIDSKQSLFQSYYTMRRDSVKNDGIAKGLEMYEILNNMKKYPKGLNSRVYYDRMQDLFSEIDYGVLYFKADDKVPTPDYRFSDSVRMVSGYASNKVTTHFLGRDWVIYYTPELPLPYGPWKINKLPGLVTEAYTIDGAYKYTLIGFEPCANKMSIKTLFQAGIKELITVPKEELLWVKKLQACWDIRPIMRKYMKSADLSKMSHDKMDQSYRERSKRYQYIEQ